VPKEEEKRMSGERRGIFLSIRENGQGLGTERQLLEGKRGERSTAAKRE